MWCQPLALSRPVLHHPICTTSPRPKLGNQPRVTANTRISRMPIRNVGSDTPSSEMVMNSWLVKVPRLRAAYTPMGTPMTRARKAATKASSSVAGKRSAISRETLAPWRRLRPNSPWAALTKKCQNCTKKGLSRPSEARSSRICSGVASWPSRNTTGSPTYWNSMKEMKATVTMTITACIRRRNIKASIGESIECSMGTPQPLLMAGRWQAISGRQTGPESKTKKARASGPLLSVCHAPVNSP